MTIRPPSTAENPFADSRFRWIFTVGAAVSWSRWAEIFAFSLIVFDLTGSSFMVVAIGLLRMIPLAGASVIGLVAHRLPARTVIASSVAAGAAVHGALIAISLGGELAVWHLGVASFVSGIALSVDFTVRRPLLGSVVASHLVGRAISTDFVANTASRIAGPAATGAIIDTWGFTGVFVAGVVLYGIAFSAILPVDHHDADGEGAAADWAAMREGYRFARNSRGVSATIVNTIIVNLFMFPYRHLVPVIGTDVLGLNATRVGLLTAMEGAGMTVASIGLAVRVRPRHFIPVIYLGTVLAGVGVIVFGLSTSVPVSVLAVFFVGIGVSAFATMQAAIVVDESPPELRSRVMGVVGTFIATNPIGLLVLGGLATVLGAAGGVVASGAIGLASIVAAGARIGYRARGRDR